MANVTIGSSQAISTTTVTKPSGVVDGSVLVVRYHWFAAGDQHLSFPTMSDSFVDIGSVSYYDSPHSYSYGVSFFRKVITNAAGEPSTYTITPVTSPDLNAGTIVRLVNCDTTTPETDSGHNSDANPSVPTSTQTTGAVIDSGAEDLLLTGATVWGASIATPSGMTQDYLQDGGDVGGFSENPGVLSGATRSSAIGSGPWANAFVVFKAAAGGGASPFRGSTFENPTRSRRSLDALSWSSNDLTIRLPVAPVSAPFTMTDWPNPRGRVGLNPSFSSNYAIDDSAPFAQLDWPNPVRAKRSTDGLSWQDELNTLLVTVPGTPFSQDDWPNPVRAKRSYEGLSWQNELNTLLFTAPVTMPFRQLSWPNPLGKTFSISLRGFAQPSAFWMLKDTFYGAPGQPPSFTPPINPRGAVFPMDLRGSTQNALTTALTPPVFTFNPAWAQGSNRTVGFGIEPE